MFQQTSTYTSLRTRRDTIIHLSPVSRHPCESTKFIFAFRSFFGVGFKYTCEFVYAGENLTLSDRQVLRRNNTFCSSDLVSSKRRPASARSGTDVRNETKQ